MSYCISSILISFFKESVARKSITLGRPSAVTQMLSLVVPVPGQYVLMGSRGKCHGCRSHGQVLGERGHHS